MNETSASLIWARFPRLAKLLGEKAIRTHKEELQRLGETALWQIEQDIALLQRYGLQREITRAWDKMLQYKEFLHVMYELRIAAMLSTVAHEMAWQVPIQQVNGNCDCDIQCVIEGTKIFVEVTTRTDAFPKAYESGDLTDAPFKGRVTVERGEWDPTTARNDPGVREIPASQELRKRIQEKVKQLPPGEVNVLVLGSRGGLSLDVEAALWGDEVYKGNSLRPTIRRERVPNGLFCIPDGVGGVSRISALVWMKLAPHFHDVRVHSRLFLNPRAVSPLPFAVEDGLLKLFDRREILQRELDRIVRILVDRYCPERVILFGSLAGSEDAVHQWSDIDLAVVKATRLPFMERIKEVTELIRPRVGVNIFVYTPEELTQAQTEGHFFIRDEIIKRGKVC